MRATRELLFAALVLLLSPFILVAAAIYCLGIVTVGLVRGLNA